MTTMSISAQILPLRLFEDFAMKAKQTNSQRKLKQGMKKILEGLALVCEGSTSAIDSLIESLMETGRSQCTDKEYQELAAMVDTFAPFFSELLESEFPQKQKELLATFIERITIYANLERQFRDGVIMQARIDLDALDLAVKTNNKGNLLEWIEV
ncbi:hypothetical protein [Shewanella fodinae]|jgi:hypothetical protein|uniref:Uncharacterized protein n=1 Tax=Shewanella fodinae TaxID=552357 RepID=A0A4R2F7A8_9GAMM|nr:hypothetical protein [Shewanella fodinae]MDN5369587.1 hypothetical protein [Shewanella sp.]TCN77720.1 hypothetical protein EDC91_14421 [Shewanella fodinae]